MLDDPGQPHAPFTTILQRQVCAPRVPWPAGGVGTDPHRCSAVLKPWKLRMSGPIDRSWAVHAEDARLVTCRAASGLP